MSQVPRSHPRLGCALGVVGTAVLSTGLVLSTSPAYATPRALAGPVALGTADAAREAVPSRTFARLERHEADGANDDTQEVGTDEHVTPPRPRGADRLPIAVDDSVTTAPGVAAVVDVLANDTVRRRTRLQLGVPAHGTASATGGVIRYTTAPQYAGVDAVPYELCTHRGCSAAVLTVLVDRSPAARDDVASGPVGTPLTVDVVGNDTDPDLALDDLAGYLNRATLRVVSGPAQVADGRLVVVPAAAPYDVVYGICDGLGLCTTGVVTVHGDQVPTPPAVPPAPAPPTAPTSTEEHLLPGGSTSVDLLALGTGTGRTVRITRSPSYVQAVLVGGVVQLSAPATFAGTDGLLYEVCDTAHQCVTSALDLRVNTPPALGNDALSVPVGGTGTVDLLANDTDPDRFIDDVAGYLVRASARLLDTPTHGTAAVDGGVLTWTPTTAGSDVLRYEVCDAGGLCSTATVTLTGA